MTSLTKKHSAARPGLLDDASPLAQSPLNIQQQRRSTNSRKYQSLKNINEPDGVVMIGG